MLFNSYEFILYFLPVTLAGYFVLARARHWLGATWLAAASLFFYGWWNPALVVLLLASIAFNYVAGFAIARARQREATPRTARRLLVLALTVNLLVLGYFKYANFFMGAAGHATGIVWHALDIVLPLGISFFTFTQIAFLVDAFKGIAREYSVVHYVLFVTYFPHLIAGPVLHHRQMMPQFGHSKTYAWNWDNVNVGTTIFILGLFKKVVLADQLALYAGPVFDAPPGGSSPTFFEAWIGALAYALQLYFDFSGYSDMAIGLSLLFNVELPLNFHSPYKATSIIDFWRRWHMTLSAFLRDYLYIPLGGNRHGPVRRYWSLAVTMLLGGLWHGANWTFVFWGGLHGFYLVVNHGWRAVRARTGTGAIADNRLVAGMATFLAVVVAWVPFRARDLDQTLSLWATMAGWNGIVLPVWAGGWVPALAELGVLASVREFSFVSHPVEAIPWLAVGLAVVWLMPTSVQWVGHCGRAIEPGAWPGIPPWRPSAGFALLAGSMLAVSLSTLGKVSPFLYFQF